MLLVVAGASRLSEISYTTIRGSADESARLKPGGGSGHTLFNLFEIVFEAIEPPSQVVILEIQLRSPELTANSCKFGGWKHRYHGKPREDIFDESRYFEGQLVVAQCHGIDSQTRLEIYSRQTTRTAREEYGEQARSLS